jgi:DNA-binding HxlR family transcriptional regulator
VYIIYYVLYNCQVDTVNNCNTIIENEESKMGEKKRSYGQHCTVARALDVVGERWTLLVVRELSTGPKRFKDLLGGLPGIGTNLLAGRLKALEWEGIVRRATLPPPAGSNVYELTALGKELEPVILALSRWGARLLKAPGEADEVRAGWTAVALRSALVEGDPGSHAGTYGFRIDGEAFHVRVADGEGGKRVEARQGSAPDSGTVVVGDSQTLLAVASGKVSLDEALASGALLVEGEREADREALLAWCRNLAGPSAA